MPARALDPRSDLVEETVRIASAALGATLSAPEDLGGSQRSTVLRCRGEGPAAPTVVVKRYPTAEEAGTADEESRDAFVRELAGLRFMARTPELLAVDEPRRTLVMSDLGAGSTLADLLLGSDRDAAWDGARAWAGALGDLLGSGMGAVDAFGEHLRSAGADWDAVSAARTGLRRLTALVGDRDLEAELGRLDVLSAPGRFAAITPGDTCPDNALLTAEGWRFLDLEGATVQHVALDAAYTVLPFATCWCVFDPPDGFTDMLVAEFSAALGRHAPDLVADPAWPDLIDLACGTWILAMSGFLIDGALEGRGPVGPAGRPSPTRRQLLSARWRWGALHLRRALPGTAALLGDVALWAEREWGDSASGLTGYPALELPDNQLEARARL